jgi:hypothetical protein
MLSKTRQRRAPRLPPIVILSAAKDLGRGTLAAEEPSPVATNVILSEAKDLASRTVARINNA